MSEERNGNTIELPVAKTGRTASPTVRITLMGVMLGLIIGALGTATVGFVWPHAKGLFADADAPHIVELVPPPRPPLVLLDEELVLSPVVVSITIKNPESMINFDGLVFGFEDQCEVVDDAMAKAIAVEGERILMCYHIPEPPKIVSAGTPIPPYQCPDGTLFFLHKDYYRRLIQHRNGILEEQERERREKETVRRLTEPEAAP